MSEIQKVRFPGGLELRIPEGMTVEEFASRHRYVSLVEGLCPWHQAPLKVAEGDSAYSPGSGRPWLHHPGCDDYWQVDTDREEWTHEPSWSWHGFAPPRH